MSTRSSITEIVRSRLHGYELGDRLPGVAEVCAEFNVGTATAVYAMRGLVAEGLIQSRQGGGGGYFIAAYPPQDAEQSRREARARLERIVAEATAALLLLEVT